MMGLIIRILAGLIVLAAAAGAGYLYQFGKPRVARETRAFADHLEACEPVEQAAWTPMFWTTFERAVIGPTQTGCSMRMEAFGGAEIKCDLPPEEAAMLAQGLRDQLKMLDITGHPERMTFSTRDPDPMTTVLNGANCEAIVPERPLDPETERWLNFEDVKLGEDLPPIGGDVAKESAIGEAPAEGGEPE